MARITFANAIAGILNAYGPGGQQRAKEQLSAVVDGLKQLVGDANIAFGNTEPADPLNSPYILYVNPYIGSDRFVAGSYNSFEAPAGATPEAISAAKLRRLDNQRLVCGYSPQRPFKTLNRAIIEAGIITAKSYYEAPLGNNDLVSIVISPGAMNVLNGVGAALVLEWEDGKEPTDAELQAFNPVATGGILLPRGCSLVAVSSDLRKTILRPVFVPSPADEAADCSNRRSIFKVTGTGYYWGLTFMDKVGSTSSHHLLHCFEFASKAELDEFYTKIRSAFGGANNTGGLNPALAVTRNSEFEIVGPRPASGNQDINTDTTISASPYIFNCSIRSNYGLCGVFADGAKPTGFRSMVLAQFTGVSMQRDLSCWQKYISNQNPLWGNYFANYADYINSDPNDVRMHPARRSFHIRAINDAIMQEVSVFAIGHGIHHWVQSGGELTITNSNSNFGGCAALAQGYKNVAFAADSNWNVGSIRVATNLADKRNNVRKVYLGNIAESTANNATTITLTAPLEAGLNNPSQPRILERDGYSLPPGSYVWVENPRGADYRAQLASTPWSSANADRVVVTAAFQNEDGNAPGQAITNSQGFDTGQTWPALAGARLYIRRLQDVRTVDERRYSLRCNTTAARSRTPVRDYVLQTTPGTGGIVSGIPDNQMLVVAAASNVAPQGSGVQRSASVELRRANAVNTWTSGNLYRPGDTVRYLSKSWSCKTQNSDTTWDPNKWEQAYVHMEEAYRPEDFWKNTQPAIVFDNDTDPLDDTLTCGYNLATVWSTDAAIQTQYRSAVDYLGVHSLLVSLGFSASNAHTILLPKTAATRERNPQSALDGIGAPSGAATAWNNWAIQFRRPSNIRLFGHAWEWSGFLNYTKSLPEYQLDLGPINRFTYFFTNQNGGRVYGSGFNEEGFLVTPQGLQNLATGTEISFEAVGEAEIPIDEVAFPTSFDQLIANKLTVNTELNLGGVVRGAPSWEGGFGGVLPALPIATLTQRGIMEFATGQEVQEFLRDDLAVSPATLIQALGDAVKSVVNLRLSLSNGSSVPSGNQLNATSLFLHPFNGNEVALYSVQSLRWQVVRFSGVQTFSLSGASSANTNYDIYLYNSGTALNPTLAVEYVAWSGDQTPPTRGNQNGVLVRNGNPARRLIGVVRATSAGTSTIDLGGQILGANSADFPKIYLSNLYNLYDARMVYFFGNSWNVPSIPWSVAPVSVYPTAPRVSWIQASTTLVTAFLDIYNNPMAGGNARQDGVIAYVAPGINATTFPDPTAFYGECSYENQTAGSQWAGALNPGLNNIYYLYRQFANSLAGTDDRSAINEHAAHGMIVTVKA
jgi:hypothetical protein